MRVLFWAAALWGAVLPAAAQYEMTPLDAPPALPAATLAAIDAHGVRISAGGKVWCEVWAAKSLATAAKSTEEAVALPTIAHGAFLGVVRFPAPAADRRGNPVAAGLYAVRYSLFPADGNHMGAAPQRDFAILIPADKDKPPADRLDYAGLMALSREAGGTPHPSVLSLYNSAEEKLPALKKEGERDWTLHVKIGSTPVAVIIAGRAES